MITTLKSGQSIRPMYNWMLGRTSTERGTIVNNVCGAISEIHEVAAQNTMSVCYTGYSKDAQDVDLYCYFVQQRTSSVTDPGSFISRTLLRKDSVLILDPECAWYRYSFVRASSTGIEMTWNDIESYFSVSISTNKSNRLEQSIEGKYRVGVLNSQFTNQKYVNFSTGGLNTAEWSATDAIRIGENVKYIQYLRIYNPNTNSRAGIAFYNENLEYISGIRCVLGSPKLELKLEYAEVPENAKYVRITYLIEGASSREKYPFRLYFITNENSIERRLDALENSKIDINVDDIYYESTILGLHTVPDSIGALNVIKRCRQMTDIKWTPAVDLPRFMLVSLSPPYDESYALDMAYNYLGTFKAGVEYTGVPYGRCTTYLQNTGYSNTYVGCSIDFGTFLTAIQDKNSVISKQSQGSISAHRSVPYAAVCSALTCYSLNVPYVNTENIPNIPGLELITALKVDGEYIDPSNFRIGDCLNLQGYHTGMVTDIAKGKNGNVILIEVSEATTVGNGNEDVVGGLDGGVCRRKGFTVEDFFVRWGEYSLYRYTNIDSVPYTPSKYVNVGNEINQAVLLDLPLVPYYGEGFVYKLGYISNSEILVNNTHYSYMRVFKNGTEISGSPFAVASGAESVNVDFNSVGTYEAYLCTMSNGDNTAVSAKCHWSVVQ